MKILLGVDGSDHAFAAVEYVGRWADPARDEIGLVHSCGPVAISTSDVNPALIDRAQQAVAGVIFAEATNRLPEGLRTRVKTFAGMDRPSELLQKSATEWPADLVVVGARGLGAFETLLLGSVSSEIVRSATVPVLVVRHTPTDAAKPTRMMIAYDAPNAARYERLLNSYSLRPGTVGLVLAVTEPYYMPGLPDWVLKRARAADVEAMSAGWQQEFTQERAALQTELTTFISRLPQAFAGHAPLIREGNPAEQILAAIAAEKIDLVIVGKTSKSGLDRFLLGSTSDKVLTNAPCSVLVVSGVN
jgi:nucleotide-binding universal stress UspA family protein